MIVEQVKMFWKRESRVRGGEWIERIIEKRAEPRKEMNDEEDRDSVSYSYLLNPLLILSFVSILHLSFFGLWKSITKNHDILFFTLPDSYYIQPFLTDPFQDFLHLKSRLLFFLFQKCCNPLPWSESNWMSRKFICSLELWTKKLNFFSSIC